MTKYPISPKFAARKVSFEEYCGSQDCLSSMVKQSCISAMSRKPTPPTSLCDLLHSVRSPQASSDIDSLVASPTSTVGTSSHDDGNSPWGQFVDVIPPPSPCSDLGLEHDTSTLWGFRARRKDRTYKPYYKSPARRKTLRKSQTVDRHLPDFYLAIPESTSVSEALGNLAM
eukprot:CAMPEP_0194047562 /NCGR_PEP_ID=MMETSP0009_2-20130614/25044_1 /TAXON_ID=210454 /ORGANISM="Grammatophora oceanica, Strain CCMP 410" /LENGTH=170 /DNA_ID=CAMNT_0038693223 /DNA_START=192 /DNA_END=704 /DNA_ORIENTATION=+